MTTCDTIKDSIGAWLDGELQQAEAEAVRGHLENCSACNEERRQLEKLQVALKTVLDSEASRLALQPFWNGVQQRIADKRSWREGLFERVAHVFAGPRLAWAIPAAILLVLGVFSLDSFSPGLRFFGPRNNFVSVESIDAHGRNVALLREDETKTTVLWLYQNPEGEDESTGEATETGHSF
jgi:predicted anti-sigma-YlaC factor YlaD